MDFMPTKGLEYVIGIGYLLMLILLWRFMSRTWTPGPRMKRAVAFAEAHVPGWFELPEDRLYHRGHSWAKPDESGSVQIGMDDFSYHLLGRPTALLLPPKGTALKQGTPGWHVRVDGHVFEILSPVEGVVKEVNEEAVRTPGLAEADPYGKGWLMRVEGGSDGGRLKNLLPHRLAKSWMDATTARLGSLMGQDLGVVLQDGGLPAYGFVRQLGGDRWHELAAELLLTGWHRSPGETHAKADGSESATG